MANKKLLKKIKEFERIAEANMENLNENKSFDGWEKTVHFYYGQTIAYKKIRDILEKKGA